ncbi:MAG: DNA polymerase I [Candidatus Gastranaerophilales bacterium]|nr:DNA polymerase I [Candidatus Gastranaerophilales bacterium]
MGEKTLVLIDGHALAYRMYFALERTGMKTSEKFPTWAIFGFVKSIVDLLKKIKPDAIAISFDVGRETFRTEEYSEYKANREAMPDSLRTQMQAIVDSAEAFNIPVYTLEGFEADDLIGTIVTKAKQLGHHSIILTGDQDSFQLIDEEGFIKVLIPSKGELVEYDTQKVYDKLNVYPEQIVDYKALRGDTSDNIPGVKGIGEKTAAKLLDEFKTLDNIYANLDKISSNSVRTKLEEQKDMAYKSQFLARICKDVDIDFNFESAHLDIPDPLKLHDFLAKYEFNSMLKNINDILKLFNFEEKPPKMQELNEQPHEGQLSLFSIQPQSCQAFSAPFKKDEIKRITVDTKEKFYTLLEDLNRSEVFAFDTETNGLNILTSKIVGVSFALNKAVKVQNSELICEDDTAETVSYYIPINHNEARYFDPDKVIELLKPVFESKTIAKIAQNAKFEYHILKNHNIELENVIFDTMIASYVNDSAAKHGLKQQALKYLKFEMQEITELIGKGKNEITMDMVCIEQAAHYACDDAYATMELAKYHIEKFDEDDKNLFYKIEMPLVKVLYNMERAGVSLDVKYLNTLSLELEGKIIELEKQILAIAGVNFNLNSPRQIGEILFERLQIQPKGKNKTKTGYSTSADILESLAKDYEIADLILKHRHLSKIKSTFVDSLPLLISKKDNRLHTSYNQTVTTTGRLSSSNPNLQNIPIKTNIGIKIRGAFVPQDPSNYYILTADYSQIELRLLAHYSQDKTLTEAFRNNEDIHSLTASKVFGVSMDKVTKDMRRKAKAVNFGIVYGQTKYGLADTLGISQQEAQEFIDKYFETYPDIKRYMEETLSFGVQNGYVTTLYGRKRYFNEELRSSNRNIREFAQRAAINSPLQGTASDLIKMAMIKLENKIKSKQLDATLIIQVHDELILEASKAQIDEIANITKECMELSQPLYVPLVADIEYGGNWMETK